MNVKINVHSMHALGIKEKGINKWKVPESTKKEIYKFIDKARIGQVNEGRRLNDATISKHLSTLKHTLEIINKTTTLISKSDIEQFDKILAKENLKSVVNYRTDLKIFLRWRLGESKATKLAGWLHTKRKKKTPDFLREDEILKLFSYCKKPSERFIIAVLFDGGPRAEEFLNIRCEDIHLPTGSISFCRLTLKEEYSKTLGRNISLYWERSLDAVREYVRERLDEGMRPNEPICSITYDAMRMFLHRLGKRVLNKKINPHLFRHSSATFYAPKLNRQQLCYRYGWKFSSDMPDVYISRAGMGTKELDDKFESTHAEELARDFNRQAFGSDKRIEEQDRRINQLENEIRKMISFFKEIRHTAAVECSAAGPPDQFSI